MNVSLKSITIMLFGLLLIAGCGERNEEKDRLADAVATEDSQKTAAASVEEKSTSSNIKNSLFRTNGAWAPVGYFKSGLNSCSDIINNSKDVGMGFYLFSENSLRLRLRVGKVKISEVSQDPNMLKALNDIDSTDAILSATVKFENGDAIVDLVTQGAVERMLQLRFRYDPTNDVLEQYVYTCTSCSADELVKMQSQSDFLPYQNGGTVKYRFCSGTVDF
jgi:hypothetical protein